MKAKNELAPEVQDYFDQCGRIQQERMHRIRNMILSIAPSCEETIRYKMPAYRYRNKPFAYFAAYRTHIGLYALPTTHARFADQLAGYTCGKGSVQFPLSSTLPEELIQDMLLFRKHELDANAGNSSR